ncbi:methionine adenosyltransferase domain-containing protein, partial [Candidatus Omnitrophota bacterium]
LARKCVVQLAYVIGRAEPVSVMIDTLDTSEIPSQHIEKVVRKVFDLTPGGIIKNLDLRRPIYRPTACYGHFGRTEKTFTWERTDKVNALRKGIK